MKITRRILRLAGVCVLALLQTSCGVKTLYNNLDWLVPWYVEDYITLDDTQQAELEKRLANVIDWHRSTQLKEYSLFMRKTRTQIKDGVTEQELNDAFAEAQQRWRLLIQTVTPELVDILLTATEEQKKELFENIEERNEDFKEDYFELSEEERSEDRVKAMQKNFKRWLGPLNEQQNNTIAHYASNFIPIHNDRWLFRLRWQGELRKLLDQDPKDPEVRTKLEKLFAEQYKLYTPEYQQKRDVNMRLIKEMILKMEGTITQEQYEHLFERIESFARMFEELAVNA